jgi:hypothetical protein
MYDETGAYGANRSRQSRPVDRLVITVRILMVAVFVTSLIILLLK